MNAQSNEAIHHNVFWLLTGKATLKLFIQMQSNCNDFPTFQLPFIQQFFKDTVNPVLSGH